MRGSASTLSFNEVGQVIERRSEPGVMVCFADTAWNVVGGDSHKRSRGYGLERPGHRHLARDSRIASFEFDRLLDAATRRELEESTLS